MFPPIYYSCSAEHGEIPGTVSIDFVKFLEYAQDCVLSLFRAGFQNVAIVNSHGGNVSILSVLQRRVNFSPKRIGTLHVFNTIDDSMAKHVFDGRGLFHAGFVETSLVESIDLKLVDHEALKRVKGSDFMTGKNGGVFKTVTVEQASPSGIVDISKPFAHGDPKKGRTLVLAIVDWISEQILELSATTRRR